MSPLPFHPATADGRSQPWLPRVVGLDLSITSTGMSDGVNHRVVQTRPDRCIESRLDQLVWAVSQFVRQDLTRLTLVVIEASAYTSNLQRGHEDLAALRLMVRTALWKLRIPYALVSPTTLKRYTTGSGKASKQEMLAALIERHGARADALSRVLVKEGRYDMADALALAAMGYAHIGHPLPVCGAAPEPHAESLATVKWPELLSDD